MAESEGPGPIVQRRRLRTELRKARQDARLNQGQVAGAMGLSPSKIIWIEDGTVGISTDGLKALLRLYKIVDDEQADELAALVRATRDYSRGSGSWGVVPGSFHQPIVYRSAAVITRNSESILVFRLLQAEEYTRTVIRNLDSSRGHFEMLVNSSFQFAGWLRLL